MMPPPQHNATPTLMRVPSRQQTDAILVGSADERTDVPGAEAEASRADGRESGFLDLGDRNDSRRISMARTGQDGRFAIHLAMGLPWRITVNHKPHTLSWHEVSPPGDDTRIERFAPVTITGQLTPAYGTPTKTTLQN